MDALTPFLVGCEITPDHALSDIRSEAATYIPLSKLTNRFLKGWVSLEEFEAALFDYGIDPDEYGMIVESNVDAIIRDNAPIEHSEFLLFDQYGIPLPTVHRAV
jgi:hypothetical protein